MAGVARTFGLIVMAVVPGGLLVLAAWILGRMVAERLRLEQGSTGHRLAQAWAHVRWRDVWTSAKQTL